MYVFSPVKLRARREAARVSREQLALAVGVGYPAVNLWELGLRSPRRANLLRIAGILGCEPRDLVDPDPTFEAVAP